MHPLMESCSFFLLLTSHLNHLLICFESWIGDQNEEKSRNKIHELEIIEQYFWENNFWHTVMNRNEQKNEKNLNFIHQTCIVAFESIVNVKWMRHFNGVTLGKMPATNAIWNQLQMHVPLKDRWNGMQREKEREIEIK